MTTREELIELVNKLFIYTDSKQWSLLLDEVFSSQVYLDMTSLGGTAEDLSAQQICDQWAEGFKDLDAINHLGGNYLVTLVDSNEAEVFAYATATHFKAAAKHGTTREFVGTYNLKMKREPAGWRIYWFVYQLKYTQGNMELT